MQEKDGKLQRTPIIINTNRCTLPYCKSCVTKCILTTVADYDELSKTVRRRTTHYMSSHKYVAHRKIILQRCERAVCTP